MGRVVRLPASGARFGSADEQGLPVHGSQTGYDRMLVGHERDDDGPQAKGVVEPMSERSPPAVSAAPGAGRSGRTLPLLLGLAIAAGGAYGYARLTQPGVQAAKPAPAPVPVTLGTVERTPFALVLNGLGTVQAYNTVQVRTRIDGEIQRVDFREGQSVRKGEILVQVDPRPYQAALDQARAKKDQDSANLGNIKADLTRSMGLGAYASRQQVETQTAQVAQLTAQVASDQAAIDNATTQVGYATVRAPIDGVTGFRQVDIGNIVNAAGQAAIVTITQVEPIFVVFTAPEDQLRAIAAALKAGAVPVEAWSTDGLTKLSTGSLALVNNQVDTATGTVRLKASYENRDHALWPGLSVSTRMRVGLVADATTVPDDAIQHGPDGLYAFVVDGSGRARQRSLTAGRSNGGRTQVLSGLSPDERVITAGQYKVQDGGLVAGTTQPRTAQAAGDARQGLP